MFRVNVGRLGLLVLAGLLCVATHAAVNQEEVDWVRQTAIPLDTVEFIAQHDDLMALLPLFEGARLSLIHI